MLRLVLFILCLAVMALGGGMARTAMALGALAFASLCAWIAWRLAQLLLGKP